MFNTTLFALKTYRFISSFEHDNIKTGLQSWYHDIDNIPWKNRFSKYEVRSRSPVNVFLGLSDRLNGTLDFTQICPFFLRRLLCLLLCPGWKIRWVFGVCISMFMCVLTYSRCLKSPGGPAPETSSHFWTFMFVTSYVFRFVVPSPNQTHTPTRAGLSHVPSLCYG